MKPEEREVDIEQRKTPAAGSHRLWCKDEWTAFQIYKVPVSSLALNIDNKRFSAERNLVEDKLQRSLDPENNDADEESVVSILCDHAIDVDLVTGKAYGTPSKDFTALRDDWLERRQAEPLWIRPNGTVHNGNRRLAMVKRLRDEGHAIDWIEAIILDPDEIDDKELFRMEQREQLAENFKKRYADINALWALKEAAEQEGVIWDDESSLERVAGILKHFAGRDDAKYALIQLRAIRAIVAYLEFIGAPGRYHLARRQVETFREVGKCMALLVEYPDEAPELVEAAFAFVQAGKKYTDIRDLRTIFLRDKEHFATLLARVRGAEEKAGWSPDDGARGEPAGADIDVLTGDPDDEGDEDDDTDSAEPEAVSPAGYPKSVVGGEISASLDEYAAKNLDVLTQLNQAIARLDRVDSTALAAALASDRASDVRALVGRAVTWSEQASGLL